MTLTSEPAATATPEPEPDESIAELTRRYSRFSHSAGGLASTIGGGLALFAYFVGAFTPPEALWGRIGLALTPFIWIVSKELLKRHYYQSFGRVEQVRTVSERRWHIGFTLFTAVIMVVVAGWVTANLVTGERNLQEDPWVLGYLALVLMTPVLVWYFMQTPLEFIVGVFLMAQAALSLVGVHYSLGQQLQAPIVGVVLLVIGVRQHLEFLKLRGDLRRRGRS